MSEPSTSEKIQRVTADFDKLQEAIKSASIRNDFEVVKARDKSKPTPLTADLREYLLAEGNSQITFSHPSHKDTKQYTEQVKNNASDLAATSYSFERQFKDTGALPREDEKENFVKLAKKVFEQQPSVLDAVNGSMDRIEKMERVKEKVQKVPGVSLAAPQEAEHNNEGGYKSKNLVASLDTTSKSTGRT